MTLWQRLRCREQGILNNYKKWLAARPFSVAGNRLKQHSMKSIVSILFFLFMGMQWSSAQSQTSLTDKQREVINLSKAKWFWMSDKNVDTLDGLFDDKAVFVHMGGTWGKSHELDVIKSGMIWYKKAEVYSVTVNIFDNTAILLNDIDLVAVVGGNEVTNPFMVTEVYINENGKWKMGSLTFSHLLRPVKMNTNSQQQH